MHLSIVMPSHGNNLLTRSRIIHACSCASSDVEVVVRDNSGDPRKREFLKSLKRDHCNLVAVDECEFDENFRESLKLAKGTFVFFVSDDDLFFDRAVASMVNIISQSSGDMSLAGIAGTYVVELSNASVFMAYQRVDSSEMPERVGGYLAFQGPNMIGYSTIRREVAIRAWEFTRFHPFTFPFHDQIVSMLYVMAGRFVDIHRLIFLYDNANWETADIAARQDRKFYSASGMDPALGRFHWFLCAFEGAMLILNSQFSRRYPLEQRQRAAAKWFEVMFARFASDRRTVPDSKLDPEANLLCAKWRRSFPSFPLDEALEDICTFIGLTSSENSLLYREFWQSVSAGRL